MHKQAIVYPPENNASAAELRPAVSVLARPLVAVAPPNARTCQPEREEKRQRQQRSPDERVDRRRRLFTRPAQSHCLEACRRRRSGRGRRLGVGRAAKQIQGDRRRGKKPVDREKMAAPPFSAALPRTARGARYFRPLRTAGRASPTGALTAGARHHLTRSPERQSIRGAR